GLSAFQLDEAHLFFGREALTGALWQRLEALHEKLDATRLLAIVGPSGSGKSSVARAGLLAALVQSPIPGPQPMRFAIVKPGERPIESLARALVPLLPADSSVLPAKQQVAIEDLLRDEKMRGEGLRRFAADLPDIATSPLVVFVDQCEEIYTLCEDAAERDRFVELLLQAAQSRSVRVSVILTLRSDFLGETQRHHNALNRLIAEQGVMVPGLSPEELRTAIAKPAEHAGRPLDAATVDLLLAEAHSNQGALPLLEFALTRIWEGMERGEEPGATLRQIGGVGGALAGEAQKIYKTLTDAEQETARRALVRLVRLGEGTRDTRRRAALSELCGRGETEAQVLAVLRKFSAENARLVTLGVDGAEAVAEVTHEALFEHWIELRKWIDEGRADRCLHDRATEAARLWDADRRPSRRLWRRPDLDLLHAYGARKPEELSPLLGAFLSDSKAQQRRESAVRWGSVLAVFLAMLVASGVYVTKEKQRAHESRLRIQALADSTERSRQQYLDTYVERAR
ncbi:MAG TPA: AAA family ATPase, partial [Pseudomonadota bacterium]|nr:AAA family ATPase [Pseudomonadota bacterium]